MELNLLSSWRLQSRFKRRINLYQWVMNNYQNLRPVRNKGVYIVAEFAKVRLKAFGGNLFNSYFRFCSATAASAYRCLYTTEMRGIYVHKNLAETNLHTRADWSRTPERKAKQSKARRATQQSAEGSGSVGCRAERWWISKSCSNELRGGRVSLILIPHLQETHSDGGETKTKSRGQMPW